MEWSLLGLGSKDAVVSSDKARTSLLILFDVCLSFYVLCVRHCFRFCGYNSDVNTTSPLVDGI